MKRALVLTLFAGLVFTSFVFIPPQDAVAGPTASPPLVFGRGLVRPKQEIPDDPLAGLPGEEIPGRGKGGGGGARSACAVLANASNERDIGDLRATLAFVKHGPKSWPCPPRSAQPKVHLRIGIDGTGKISTVEPVAGNGDIATAMAKRLTGKTIGPRAEGATVGIVVLTFSPGRA